jgi:hypothetical protein
MKLTAWLLALNIFSYPVLAQDASANTVQKEIEALRGLEYVSIMPGQKVASHLSCTEEGGSLLVLRGVLNREWSKSLLQCQGHWVITLNREIAAVSAEGHVKSRIIDTLVLPPVQFDLDPDNLEALRYSGDSECEIKGLPNTTFIALVRFGNRKRVDWRNGVEKAWTFDIKQGRIVPVSTKRIVCEPYEP